MINLRAGTFLGALWDSESLINGFVVYGPGVRFREGVHFLRDSPSQVALTLTHRLQVVAIPSVLLTQFTLSKYYVNKTMVLHNSPKNCSAVD